jgi:hypothetical protein
MDPACRLSIFDLTVDTVLSVPAWTQVPRDLAVIEVFSGVGSVTSAALVRGFAASSYDKNRLPGTTDCPLSPRCEDITTEVGFKNAVRLVMRLRVGGLLWLAPVCSSWGFMNSSHCKRHVSSGYIGDMSRTPVQMGNRIANASAFLIMLANGRGAEAAMENPCQSTIFKFAPVAAVIRSLSMVRSVTHRCAFCAMPDGDRFLKAFAFVATGTWITQTAEPCKCTKGHKQLVVRRRIAGKVKVTGIKSALTLSGAYPAALGQRIVESWSGRGAVAVQRSTFRGAGAVAKKRRKTSSTTPTVRSSFRSAGAVAKKRRKTSSTTPTATPEVSGAARHHADAGETHNRPSWMTPSASPTYTSPSAAGGTEGAQLPTSTRSWMHPPAQ